LLTIVLVFTYVFASLYDMLIWSPSDDTAALMNVVGAAATLLMWTKLFYWMRLFKPFAFFIRMIKDMIGDSMVFMCMLMLIWAGYANVLIVLNRNRVSDDSIYDRHFNIDVLDSFLNSYMLGLGEFALDNFDVSNNWIMWVLFVGATFMIQIVFMNVLIAIMSETYGNIKAISEQSLYREMVSLMNDYVFLVSTTELFEGNKYLVWIATE